MNLLWQAIRKRLLRWLAPGLPRLLQRSLNTIELQEARAVEYRSDPDDLNLRLEIIGELREAAALAHGAPWQGKPANVGRAAQQLLNAAESVKDEVLQEARAEKRGDAPLRETIYGMAELEIALEDRGWKRLIAQSHYEFSRFGIQSITLICRLYWIKNSLARRGVDVSAFYVFGRGIEISSPDEDANEVLQSYFGDPRNACVFSHRAMVDDERKTYTDGNIFWANFTDPSDGQTITREFDSTEIADIICDPDDASTEWFYRREWTKEEFNPAAEIRTHTQEVQWYVALGYEDMPTFPKGINVIEGRPVARDSNGQYIPVLHLKEGALPGWKFGCARMYCVLDWLRAYRHVLEDLCTLWRAFSRFAYNVETKGGAPAIAALKQVLATTLANDLSQIETNPPPVTGSAFISGPNTKISPFQSGGATTMNPDNARRVLLMVCAGFGIGEHLMGDATTGSLATAASLERPTELMFLERQEIWREIRQRQGFYALSRSAKAPKGKLREAFARRWGIEPSEVDPAKIMESVVMPMPGIKFREKEGAVSSTARACEVGQRTENCVTNAKPPESDLATLTENPANLGKYLHPKGGKKSLAKKKQDKISIDVKFPDILAHDISSRVSAIVSAMTLGNTNGQVVGIDGRTAIGLLLSELGVEDVQAVVEAMYPEDEYDAKREEEEQPAPAVPGQPPIPNMPPAAAQPGQQPPAAPAKAPATPKPAAKASKPGKAKESDISDDPEVIDRAMKALIEAARKRLAERTAA